MVLLSSKQLSIGPGTTPSLLSTNDPVCSVGLPIGEIVGHNLTSSFVGTTTPPIVVVVDYSLIKHTKIKIVSLAQLAPYACRALLTHSLSAVPLFSQSVSQSVIRAVSRSNRVRIWLNVIRHASDSFSIHRDHPSVA